ncbi:MAG: hypothetical protein AAF493_13530, partial [Pseudomonadota bacterium]
METLATKTARRLRHAAKQVYNTARPSARDQAQTSVTLLLLGCQQSGDAFFAQIFERDWKTQYYGPDGDLFDDTFRQRRLKSLPEINQSLSRERSALRVIAPLVESQQTADLLQQFQPARALWL